MTSSIARLLAGFAFLLACPLLSIEGELRAQSPDWSAVLMAPAFPSPYISEWERNPQNLTLTVVHTGQGERQYQVEAVVRELRRGELARAESPLLIAGGISTTVLTAADLSTWKVRLAQSADIQATIRSGAIPEGEYEVCTRILSPQRVQLAEDCAHFSVVLPEAPQLIFPGAGDPVLTMQPTFQWTPVLLPPGVGTTYRLRVVERLPSQTPQAALRANRTHHEEEISGVPFYHYPIDAVPLEPGKEYVWQVEALDAMGQPLVPGGLASEIWTFRADRFAAPGVVGEAELLPDTVELVPGLARLIGLRGLEGQRFRGLPAVVEDAFGYTLNGRVRLEIEAPYRIVTAVDLDNFKVDRFGGLLRVTGGEFGGELGVDAISEEVRGSYTHLDRIEYSPATGLVVRGKLALPGSELALDGHAQVTAFGLYGVLEATASGRGALASVGSDPVELRLQSARVTLPGGRVDIEGDLALFGTAMECAGISGTITEEGGVELSAACVPQRGVLLAGAGGEAELALHMIAGRLDASFATGSFDYDLELHAGIALAPATGGACSTRLDLGLTPSGLSFNGATPRCDPSMGEAALDWLALGLSNLRVDRFDYSAGSGFDFALKVDVAPSVPTVPGFDLPAMTDIEISRAGLEFPSIDVDAVSSPIDLAGYRLRISKMALESFTLPWEAWGEGRASGFDFALDLNLTMPELPAGAPACLAANSFRTTARLADGKLTATIIGDDQSPLLAAVGSGEGATFSPGSCRFALGEGVAFDIERFGGEVVLDLFPMVEVAVGAEITGGIEFPILSRCSAGPAEGIRVSGGLRIGPRGGLSGRVSGIETPCPIDLGAIALQFSDALLDFGEVAGARSILLRGGGTGLFTAFEVPASGETPVAGVVASAREVAGRGTVALDLLRGVVSDGSITFDGPFQLDLPREEPFLSFTLGSARLDSEGLHLDGRHSLLIPGGESIGTTFNNVTLGLGGLRLEGGEIRFDTPFAIDAGLGSDGRLTWRTVAPEAPLAIGTGARIGLPAAVVIDSAGFRAEGVGGARILFDGQDIADLGARFSERFTLGLEPLGVTDGVIEFRHNDILFAHIDAAGFHPNWAQLALGQIPDRFGIPNVEIAYLELRDGEGDLNVTVTGDSAGTRLTSQPGGVPLVLPVLAGDGGEAPRVNAEFELILDRVTNEVVGGSVTALVPEGASSPFDLTAQGIPFVANRIEYGPNEEGVYGLAIAGRLALLGEAIGEPGSLELEITGGGRLAGEFAFAASHTFALVPGSDRLRYTISGLEGSFDVGLNGGKRAWSVDHDGRLEVALGEGDHFPVAARLRASQHGLTFSEVETGAPDLFHYFDLGSVRLGLGNLRIPRIEHSDLSGWDFDIDFDLALSFPELGGLEIPGGPGLREIRLGTDGFTIPKLMVGELRGAAFEWGGFSLEPLAFRMEPLKLDIFGAGGGLPNDWGFSFDFEVSLGDLVDGAPLGLSEIRLSALDVGFRGGRLVGSIEPFEFPNPVALPLGLHEMALNLLALGGKLNDAPGLPRLELDADVSWTLPTFLRCEGGSPTTLALAAEGEAGVEDQGAGRFRLAGDGTLSGAASGIAPNCPLELGPIALGITTSDLEFTYSPRSESSATLKLDGFARLPGLAEGDTIEASGSLTLDLLALEVIDGGINVPGPFRWDLPRKDPFLQFVVEEGRLDSSGFTLAGTGSLRLGDDASPATVGARFNDLALGLPDFGIRSGNVTFDNDFAVAVTLEGGALRWAALPSSSERPSGDGFRITVPSGAVLGANGLALSGEATGELAFADSVFSALTVAFEDDFRVGVEPIGVREGRAGFIYNGTEVAYLDRQGFHPGDIFGVLAIPDTLPLPTTRIAFIELRDPSTGELRVVSETTEAGLRVTGRNLPLVIPGLARGDDAPALTIGEADLTLDPRTFRVVGGALEVAGRDGGPLVDLTEQLGMPLALTRIRYSDDDGEGYQFRVGLRVEFPEALNDLIVALDDVTLGEDGLEGEVRLGSFRPDHDPAEAPLATAELLANEIDAMVQGLRLDFTNDAIDFAGSFGLALFADSTGRRTPVPFTASARGGSIGGAGPQAGFTFSAHADSIPGGIFSLGFATFEPKPVDDHPGLSVLISDEEVALRFGGELNFPTLGDDFSITLAGIEVGTKNGVVVPEIELTAEQEFTLFGTKLTLKRFDDAPNDPGLAVRYDGETRVLGVELSGEIEFPFTNQVPRFRGLRASTDGRVSLAYASLISDTVTIVNEVLTLDEATIESDSLRLGFGVELPEPLHRGARQSFHLAIASDGTVSGGGHLVLHRNESDDDGVSLGVATVHLRHVDLEVRAADGSAAAAIRAVADVDLAGRTENRVNLGWIEGGTVRPGLTIDFEDGISWGNVAIQDTVTLPLGVFDLAISEIKFEEGRATRDFRVGVNGDLAFDLEMVAGGLAFEDMWLTHSLELDRDEFRVHGGHFGIADVIFIGVENFSYSDQPTTLQVVEIGMPTEDSDDISKGVREVEVTSYVQLGGSIGIGPGCSATAAADCLLSGGVDLFQFYRTPDGRTSFLVRNANLQYGDVFTMGADLLYRTGERQGFELLLGAEAEILGHGGAVVGLIDNTESTLRAGLFARVEAPIPVAPPLTLAGVGGGFFYNPKAEHIELVKKYAGMTDHRAEGAIQPTPGAFTGLIYAGATIADQTLAHGRVLLTVSESYAQLQGELDILEGGGFGTGPLASGWVDLTVGFKQKFADGNIGLAVDLDPIATGSGQLGFYVYGEDAWGIYGQAELEYVKLINGDAGFFVGPTGFMASGHLGAGFDFWIIRLEADVDASVWYQRNPRDLGAYMAVGAEASLLGGVLSANGTIRGALLAGGGQSPMIYGGALAQGCAVLVGCASANIWAKFQDGRATGGFGHDPALDEILARANAIREGMDSSRSAMEENLAESRPPVESIVLSDDELAQIYHRIAGSLDAVKVLDRMSSREFTICHTSNDPATGGYRDYCTYSMRSDEADLHSATIDIIFQRGMPEMWESEREGYREAVVSKLSEINRLQNEVASKFDGIALNLSELQQLSEEPWPESPVTMVSFSAPQTTTSFDAEGNELRVVVPGSGPGFEVDASASSAIKSDLSERQARTEALLGEIRKRIDEMEASSARIRALLRERGEASISSFLELHNETSLAAEEELARHGAMIYDQMDWYNDRLRDLAGLENSVRTILGRKTSAFKANNRRDLIFELGEKRFATLDTLAGGNRLAAFRASYRNATDEELIREVDDVGVELWYRLSLAGLQGALARADTAESWLRTDATQRLAVLRRQHRDLTTEIHRLSVRHADLVGVIYDLYDRYDHWLESAEAGGSEEQADEVRAERSRVANRMDQLEKSLRVPTVSATLVGTKNLGHLAEETYLIIGSGEASPYEYLLEYTLDGLGDASSDFSAWIDQESSPGLRSIGTKMGFTRYVLAPGYGISSSRTSHLLTGVRGGAGYLGVARTEYTTHFGRSGGGAGSSTLTGQSADTSPPSKPTVEIRAGEGWTSGGPNTWIADPDRIEVRWHGAHDAESGIAEYQYSIGYRNQPGSVVPWTSAGGRTSLVIQNADLREDAGYFVFVRARNGSGLWSEIAQSGSFQVDRTAPYFDEGASLTPVLPEGMPGSGRDRYGSPGLGVGHPAGPGGTPRPPATPELTPEQVALQSPVPACQVPAPTFMHQAPATFTVPKAQVPAWTADRAEPIKLQIPVARDPESGVAKYYWRVDIGSPSTGFATEDGWSEIEGNRFLFEVDLSEFEYGGESQYVTLVAVNHAGLVSEPIYRSVTPVDQSPPLGLSFCVGQHSVYGQLFMAVSSAALDPESGIRGYQYRVRGEDGSIVRDWSSSLEEVDFNSVTAGSKVYTETLPLVDGASYYLDLRAINGYGLREVVTSGPVRVDFSSPPTPSAEIIAIHDYYGPDGEPDASAGGLGSLGGVGQYLIGAQLNRQVKLEVRVVIPDDPHSGVVTHQWEVVPFNRNAPSYSGVLTGQSATQGLAGQGFAGQLAGHGGAGPIQGLLGGTSGASSGPPHGTITGVGVGTFTVTLTSAQMADLNDAAPGSEYELRIRTINGAGLPSTVQKIRFELLRKIDEVTTPKEAEFQRSLRGFQIRR